MPPWAYFYIDTSIGWLNWKHFLCSLGGWQDTRYPLFPCTVFVVEVELCLMCSSHVPAMPGCNLNSQNCMNNIYPVSSNILAKVFFTSFQKRPQTARLIPLFYWYYICLSSSKGKLSNKTFVQCTSSQVFPINLLATTYKSWSTIQLIWLCLKAVVKGSWAVKVPAW